MLRASSTSRPRPYIEDDLNESLSSHQHETEGTTSRKTIRCLHLRRLVDRLMVKALHLLTTGRMLASTRSSKVHEPTRRDQNKKHDTNSESGDEIERDEIEPRGNDRNDQGDTKPREGDRNDQGEAMPRDGDTDIADDGVVSIASSDSETHLLANVVDHRSIATISSTSLVFHTPTVALDPL